MASPRKRQDREAKTQRSAELEGGFEQDPEMAEVEFSTWPQQRSFTPAVAFRHSSPAPIRLLLLVYVARSVSPCTVIVLLFLTVRLNTWKLT